jgi:hypothetical protein
MHTVLLRCLFPSREEWPYYRKQSSRETGPNVGGERSLNRPSSRKQLALTSEAGGPAASPSLPSYAATKALTTVNGAALALQKAA